MSTIEDLSQQVTNAANSAADKVTQVAGEVQASLAPISDAAKAVTNLANTTAQAANDIEQSAAQIASTLSAVLKTVYDLGLKATVTIKNGVVTVVHGLEGLGKSIITDIHKL